MCERSEILPEPLLVFPGLISNDAHFLCGADRVPGLTGFCEPVSVRKSVFLLIFQGSGLARMGTIKVGLTFHVRLDSMCQQPLKFGCKLRLNNNFLSKTSK